MKSDDLFKLGHRLIQTAWIVIENPSLSAQPAPLRARSRSSLGLASTSGLYQTPSMPALFVTWDGPTSNYLESLYFPVFSRLTKAPSVLQFTFAGREATRRTELEALRQGVDYLPVAVPHFRPLAASAVAAVAVGATKVAWEVWSQRIDVLVVRSIIPAMMVLLARRLLPQKLKLVYDADGLAQDEKVEFEGWKDRSTNYRVWRRAESAIIEIADLVLTRTKQAQEILSLRSGVSPAKIEVIPNGSDELRFQPKNADRIGRIRANIGLSMHIPLIVYCGSMGAQYRPDLMLDFLSSLKLAAGKAHMLVLTGGGAQFQALARLRPALASDITVMRASPTEVPDFLAAADVGLSLREPSFSQRAVCPIKVGEYLLSGTPVVANRGVGDLDSKLAGSKAAKLLPELTTEQLEQAAAWVSRCVMPQRKRLNVEARALGEAHFGLRAMRDGYERACKGKKAAPP